MAKLSAVIITHNEAQRIKKCLESLRWADEIIVADAQSTDGTPDICREYTRKVYSRRFVNFSDQKNYGISCAAGEWILSIDADEVVPEGLASEIREAVNNSTTYVGFYIRRENHMYGQRVHHGQPDYQLRLFKKGQGQFVQPVHEVVELKGRAGYLKNSFVHFSMENLSSHTQKLNQYTELELEILRERGLALRWHNIPYYLFLKPVLRFFQNYFLMKGYRDGICGFILSVNAAVFDFVRYAKYWERQGCKR